MALEGVFRDWRRQQSLFPFLRRQFFDVAAVHGFLEAHLPDGADFPAAGEEAALFLEGGFAVKLCGAGRAGEGEEFFAAAIYGAPVPAAEAGLAAMAADLFARFDLTDIQLALSGPEDARLAGVKRRLEALNLGFAVSVGGEAGFAITLPGLEGPLCSGGAFAGGVGCRISAGALSRALAARQAALPGPMPCDFYFAVGGEEAELLAMGLAADLRGEGFFAETGFPEQDIRAQQAQAAALGARYLTLVNSEAMEKGGCIVENAATGERTLAALDSETLSRLLYDAELGQITESFDAAALQGLFGGAV